MPPELSRGERIQRKYYADTAGRYDEMHAHEGVADPLNMQMVQAILRMIDARSVLDVGTATGRGLRALKNAVPSAFVCGIEPVAGLVRQAVREGNADCGPVVLGSGSALPFADASFDAVCEFAVLHHVADPSAVIREMLRVAKRAVLILDSNRFGQGPWLARLAKLALFKTGLWGAYDYVRTRGKHYQITEGDGVAYSYSVYDSFETLSRWADRVILYSDSDKQEGRWAHPLLTCGGVLLCALKGHSSQG
ncbi:MAG TPA: class I SAM-dependent methyltransferase [Candidatus Acidoferrum sp.]|nr:class I SAM-dependent methyltransferase [Candidatus Acidoferrum sp.]